MGTQQSALTGGVDRFVRPLDAHGQPTGELTRFSTFLSRRNLILLGDPGAGKSHLFRAAGGDSVLTARYFCLEPIEHLRAREVVFIDALDEKRTGRNDSASVDEIVRRLIEVQPKAVRLSCRAADWLGTSDLGALNVYFNAHDGVTLLALEPLDAQSVAEVLLESGIKEPAEFVEEAEQRGMRELLGNPQNLKMLAAVVVNFGWPSSRRDLFARAVELLLTEHDKEHSRKSAFSANELLMPAGAASAARLLADVEGISLLNVTSDTSFPSYRDIGLIDPELMETALRRRAFVRTNQPEAVDYAHRTIAEYLAANFLADRIRSGALPFGRVQRMLCVEGRPASELRGLHAWLATLLPQHASKLIVGDPFGVLVYGDAAALSTSHRRELLEGLSQLSEKNPWFRGSQWSTATLGALATADMTESLRGILTKPDQSRSLLIVVLDALRTSAPSTSLIPELAALLKDRSESHGVRWRAFDALMSIGAAAHDECVSIYRGLSEAHAELATRATMLEALHAAHLLDASDIAAFINDAIPCAENDRYFSLYRFGQRIAPHMAAEVLDLVRFHFPKEGLDSAVTRQAFELIDQLLARCVHSVNDAAASKVVEHLARRAAVARYRTISDTTLHDALKQCAQLQSLTLAAINYVQEQEGWECFIRVNEILIHAASTGVVLECMMYRIRAKEFTRRDYALALHCVMYEAEHSRKEFEELYALADERTELAAIRADYCCRAIPDYHWEQAKHRSDTSARQIAQKAKDQQDFDAQRLNIVSGLHLNWLGYLAHFYFGLFTEAERGVPPVERLKLHFGELRALDAVEGLRELVRSGRRPHLREIITDHSKGNHYRWWYAALAGLDEFVVQAGDLESLPLELIESAFVMSILLPTYGNAATGEKHQHAWAAWFVSRHPRRACDALLELIRTDLAQEQTFVHGIHELLGGIVELRLHRGPYVAKLLTEFPAMNAQYLRQLLRNVPSNQSAAPIIKRGLDAVGHGEKHKLWLAAGLIADFAEFRPAAEVILEKNAQRELVLSCMTLLGSREQGAGSIPKLSLPFTEFILRRSFTVIRRVEFDDTEDHHRSEWECTQFTLELLNRLSANVEDEARALLERCLDNPSAHSYREHIKYCLVQQEVHRIDAAYSQPSWTEALRVLSNGKPVSVADLHALVLAHLEDIRDDIRTNNVDIFQGFWNEDPKTGKVSAPKHENSGRNVLIGLLRGRLAHLDIAVEPEAQMANENRADIGIYFPKMKIVVELKRHYHDELWTAATEQLERFYVKHREAQGFGIFGVFWYGTELAPLPVANARIPDPPASAEGLLTALTVIIPDASRAKLRCIVFDVSDIKADANAAKKKRMATKKVSANQGRASRKMRQ